MLLKITRPLMQDQNAVRDRELITWIYDCPFLKDWTIPRFINNDALQLARVGVKSFGLRSCF